jgi:hypothetical protein
MASLPFLSVYQVVVKRPRVVLSRKDDQHSGATAARIQGLEALLRRSNPLRNVNVVFMV